MRMVWLFVCSIIAFVFSAADAQAGPVFFAVVSAGGSVWSAFGATALGGFLTTTITGRLLTSVALTALQTALQPRPRTPGITTERRATGGTNPCAFPLGKVATAGDEVCPPMTHGKHNNYLTMVIALSDIPGVTLSRFAIDGEWVTTATETRPEYAQYGDKVMGRFENYAWIEFKNGNQVAADPMLLAIYGTHPERPWTSNMVGTGIAYAILTFYRNAEIFPSEPQLLFELGGIRLYDPRKDSTVGGSGAHRWAFPGTWETTDNPHVIKYNIHRGISLPDFGVWGGKDIGADDLPLASWFAAMNAADATITTLAGVRPRFRTGMEVRTSMTPADVIEEIDKATQSLTCEVGGYFKTRCGGPGLPVLFITDDDIITTRPQDLDLSAEADSRPNGIDAKHPSIDDVWATVSAPPVRDATFEAEDGKARHVTLDLPACPYTAQAQGVMRAYLKDGRRARKVTIYLPPDAAILEPLDVISWTSTRNGFVGKLFEVAETAINPRTLIPQVMLREVNPADYDWVPASEVAVAVPVRGRQTLPALTVRLPDFLPYTVRDGAATARRPGGRFVWEPDDLIGVRGIQWQVRLTGGSIMARGSQANVTDGEAIVAAGMVGATGYEGRLRLISDLPSSWTGWMPMTTPAIGFGNDDFAAGALAGDRLTPHTVASGQLYFRGGHGPALNADPNCRDLSAWTWSDGAVTLVTDTTSEDGNTALQSNGVLKVILSDDDVDIKKGANYVASFTARQIGVTPATSRGIVAFYDAAGALLPGTGLGWPAANSLYAFFGLLNTEPPSTFTDYQISFGPDEVAKIPVGARTMRIGWQTNVTGTGVHRFSRGAIARQAKAADLDPNALQDTFRTTVAGRFTRAATPNNTVLATLDIGAVGSGRLLRRGVHFEARRPGTVATFTADTPRVELQARDRSLGQPFTPWRTVDSWREADLYELGTGTGVWEQKSSGGSITSPSEQFQYRLIVINNSNHGNTTTDWIGNVWLTVANLTKGA